MGPKLKFVLSDLHIGAGYANEGGNPLEDFTANEAFVDFLHEIRYESNRDQREIELIINGDFFEFLQVPAVESYDPAAVYAKEVYFDSSEKASIKRLNIIAKGHPDIFNGLSDFIHVEAPQRRITVIKGNHDVHLFWPGVKNRLREILGASGTRVSLLRFANEFVSREKIYVEHGHQRAEKINNYPDSFNPRSPDDLNQLYYPPGSRFVIDFFNEVERDWWFVDHSKPGIALIWYALSQNFDLACQGLVNFVRYSTASGENGSVSGDGPITPAGMLLQDLENDKKRWEMSQHYAKNRTFRQRLHQQIKQYFGEVGTDEKDVTLSPSEISDDPIEMGRACQKQQQIKLRQAAEKIAKQEGAKVILFGHTHHPTQVSLRNGSIYINTGSWIENLFDAPLETWEALFDGLQQPGDTPSRLPYARIDYDKDNNPSAKLLYFNKEVHTNTPLSVKPVLEVKAETTGFFEKNFQWIARFLRAGS